MAMTHKSIAAALLAAVLCAPHAGAVKFNHRQVPAANLALDRDAAGRASLTMDLDVSALRPDKDREYCITPVLVAADGTDSLALPSVVVAGRSMYYQHLRDNDLGATPLVRAKKDSPAYPYTASFSAAPWVDNSELRFQVQERNCCDVSLYDTPVATVTHVSYTPVFNYVTPVADTVKTREINRRAYVNFPVNRVQLFPDYMSNPVELRKITGTIDSVRSDRDITITAISIKGFASPEGPYDNNVRLAKGRTETLRQYVESLYDFKPGFIRTSYEPEDWEGLADYLKTSGLPSRKQILDIIANPALTPDAKDWKIRKEFPSDYAFLLSEVYPTLRHSDYRIEYNIRSYTTLDDILRVLRTAPQKLSLAEFYRAAQSMEPGSPEYNETFGLAARMYPDAPAANLNAANIAMSRGDYAGAARFLDRSGDGAEVTYARGVLAALQGDYAAAESAFAEAARLKVADAPAALSLVREVTGASGRYYRIAPASN